MNEKSSVICPLLSIHEEDFIQCQGEHCAWYVPPVRLDGEGRCAVQFLGALPELRERGGAV